MKIDIEKMREKLNNKTLFFRLSLFDRYCCCAKDYSCTKPENNLCFHILNEHCYYTVPSHGNGLMKVSWEYLIDTIKLNPDLIKLWDIRDCVNSEE